ncbi:hypothetical protein AbraCBS73388_006037, partial [Aspergillus brasiliensis]
MTVSKDDKENQLLLCKGTIMAPMKTQTFAEYSAVKTFAYMMLEYAAPIRGQDNGYLSLSQRIIETAAVRLDKLETSERNAKDSQLQQYTIGYYILRVYLAWLQGRLDIAEHLFSKIPVLDHGRGQEHVMDICYKIGNCALSRKQYDVSSPVLSNKDKELLILHASVRAGLHLDTKEPNELLNKVLDALKSRYGSMFAVQVIQLELLSKEEPNKDVFLRVLQNAIESSELGDSHLTMHVASVNACSQHRPEVSIRMLKQLLKQAILIPRNETSPEKVFITFICGLIRLGLCTKTGLDIFQETISSLKRHYKMPLSETATEATLILIWKHVNKTTSNDDNS